MRIISPSLLSADFQNINNEIKSAEKAGVNRFHLDVMDGHFVPNITFGPFIINAIRKCTTSHLETHLMISDPHKYVAEFIKAGSDTIIIHQEACRNIKGSLKRIRDLGVLAGIAINPDTDEKLLIPYLDYLDYILVMSVFPGFGGQSFIENTLGKMENIVEMSNGYNITIGVDGGVNIETINRVYQTGIDIAIVGSGFFKADNLEEQHQELLNA